MEGKLIKREDGYYLFTDESYVNAIASDHKNWIEIHDGYKLSIKNCDEIERGYDLFELAHEACNITDPLRLDSQKYKQDPYFRIGFNKGFQKALEILGDKKFSEDDMIKFMQFTISIEELGNTSSVSKSTAKYYLDNFTSNLQQTEWDVEIEMVSIPADRAPNGWDISPKLDVDGCLILRIK